MGKKNQQLITALYERLSHDDDLQGESNSISNQKRVLEDFARQQGFTNVRHYTDDGISGTRFDRPGFQAMMEDIQDGKVAVACLKDMSRFGRDYLQVGTYMEVIRKAGVRLIALNDNVDTLKGEDEFTPFRNIMNEWYARDTSKKIRSAFQARNMAGKPTASSPSYGYLKSPDNKDQWIIDPVAAPIVKRIFQLSMEGKGPYQIAKILSADKVEIPAYHQQKLGIGLWQSREIKNPYNWGSSTIVHILENPVYLGHTCNFKTRKHFKDKKSHYVDQDEWTIIENTHEAIIDQDTFDNVQRLRSSIRRYPDGWGETHPLSGLMFCADCGSVMYIHRINNGKRIPTFDCAAYHKTPVGSVCPSAHRIHASVVLTLVKETLREIVKFSSEDEAEFKRLVEESIAAQQDNSIKEKKARLTACLKRQEELEVLICKIYEDNALGKLLDKRYQMLDAQYAGEQDTLEKEIRELKEAVAKSEKQEHSASKFIALVKKYQDFEELTTPMLIEFVDKILVHEREVKGRIDSPQTIEIYFNFIGKFSVPHDEAEPTPEEIELEQRKEQIRQKRHEEYLRRKSTGWQATYYWKNKRALKEKRDAAKEKIRAEDRENGIYYLPKQKDSDEAKEAVQ